MIGFGLLAATCAVAVAAVGDAITLKYTPKVGDLLKYKMAGHLSGLLEADFGGEVTYKITKVDPDGTFTTDSTQSDLTFTANGQTQKVPDSTSTVVSKANGEIVDMTSGTSDPNAWRVAELTNFIYPDKPVSVGDTWTSSVTADAAKNIVAAKADYKVEALEKVGNHDTAKVKVSYKETEGSEPASSDTEVWIDTKDGSMVKADSTWTNMPSPMGATNAKLSLTRED